MEPGSRLEEEAGEPREVDDLTLRRARRGDERACHDLVAHYQGDVFALLGRLLCGARRRDVEGLAEATLVRVLRDLPRCSIVGAARLSSFILTVATRLGLDSLRRRRAKPALPRDVTLAAPAAGEEHGVGAAVRRAAAALPPESRAALLLRDYHHLELQEIARALEIEVSVVRTRLRQARAAIRAAVGEAGISSGAGHG
jgi:RNA polymerase sigma-70 factor, ECF subfamily